MLISVRAPHRAGGLNISGVDVIVYSWLKGLAGTSIWRISVDNIHAFVVCISVRKFAKKNSKRAIETAKTANFERICIVYNALKYI